MKSLLATFALLPLLIACSTTKQTEPLLNTVNIGVLEGTRLDDWRLLANDNQGIAGKVITLPYAQLLNELALGNLDLVVGIPETKEVADLFPHNSVVVASRRFDYLVFKDDTRRLNEYVFERSFLNQVKRLGYVASGESGVVNDLVMPEAKIHQTYVACESMVQCHAWLINKEIDAIYTDVDQVEQVEMTQNFIAAGFEKSIDFTLLMNKKTLTENEQKTLENLFSP